MAKTDRAANSTPAKGKSVSSIRELSTGAEGSRGNSIIALASSFHYVRSDEKLGDFALALAAEGTPAAVAVVDGENRALGVVVKRDFQENLSKLYWRDLHRDERMQAHRVEARSIDATMPILSAADELLPDMSETGVRFFLLEREGKFAGIFSSLDLFRYLTVLNQKDLALAKFLQGRLTPEKHRLKTEHGVLYGTSRMARGVGGDYYRASSMPDGSVRAAVCDVSGKGVAASLVTAVLAGMLEVDEQSGSTGPLGVLLGRINRFICKTFEHEKFVTGVFVEWNPRSRQMDLYDCGHGMTYLWRRGSFLEIDTHGSMPPLGVDADASPGASRLVLEAGDVVVVCTDGILEQPDPSGQDYGVARLAEVVHRACKSDQVEGIPGDIARDVLAFRKTQFQQDDLTLLVLHQR